MRIFTLLSFTLITCFLNNKIHGQFDFDKQVKKVEHNSDIIDPVYGITLYEPLNLYLHSDSTRIEEGYAVNGWKEDHYSTGELLHKGYYIEGQLKVYKNFYPNGNVERNFKAIDSFKSKLTLSISSRDTDQPLFVLKGNLINFSNSLRSSSFNGFFFPIFLPKLSW